MHIVVAMEYVMLAKVRRNGNSFVLTIPPNELKAAGVSVGDLVEVTINPVDVTPRLRPELKAIVDEILADPETLRAMQILGDD